MLNKLPKTIRFPQYKVVQSSELYFYVKKKSLFMCCFILSSANYYKEFLHTHSHFFISWVSGPGQKYITHTMAPTVLAIRGDLLTQSKG